MERLTTVKEITADTDMAQQPGYSQIYKRLAEYEDADERKGCCDKCRHKLQSEAWQFYRYPCSECVHRVKNQFTPKEATSC